MTDWAPEKVKTLDRAYSAGEITKPRELIDVVSPMGLSLQARKVYNLLLESAHGRLGEADAEHEIPLSKLRGAHKGNERIDKILNQLMSTIITIRIHGTTGRRGLRKVQLLGGNEMVEEDVNDNVGVFRYSFDPKLITVLLESRIYAQLKKDVIFAFESKFSLVLYEVLERRRNLKHIINEVIPLQEFRVLLDVDPDVYPRFAQLNQKVIKVAQAEVNHLCDFSVSIEPVKTGRKVTALRLSWWMKSAEEKKAAQAEVKRSRIGRKSRREATVEDIAEYRSRLRADIERAGKPPAIPGLEDEIVY